MTRLARHVGCGGDTIAAAAVDHARVNGEDTDAAWRSAEALIEGIARYAPQVTAPGAGLS